VWLQCVHPAFWPHVYSDCPLSNRTRMRNSDCMLYGDLPVNSLEPYNNRKEVLLSLNTDRLDIGKTATQNDFLRLLSFTVFYNEILDSSALRFFRSVMNIPITLNKITIISKTCIVYFIFSWNLSCYSAHHSPGWKPNSARWVLPIGNHLDISGFST